MKSGIEKDIKKRAWLICAIFCLCACEAPLILLSIIGLIAAFPVGIIMFGLCGLLGWGIFKLIRKEKVVKLRVKEYYKNNPLPSPKAYIHGDTTYCFVSPASQQNTVRIILNTFSKIGGKIRQFNENEGYICGVYPIDPVNPRTRLLEAEFFVSREGNPCKVRAFFKNLANDEVFDRFLSALFEQFPGVDFGVSCANGCPYVVGVLYLGGDTEQVHVLHTEGHSSVDGFLLDGGPYGGIGVFAGSVSGRTRTEGHTYMQFSDAILARIIYNNGRIWEGSISKDSKLYNEIMVNFQ